MKDYYTLRRIYHEKVTSGEVEVKKNDNVLNKSLPKHGGKVSYSMITGFDEMMAELQEIPPSL